MTLRLIAKGTFSHVSWIQEHDWNPFERTREPPTRLNVFKFVLGTLIGHTNGTDIEGDILGANEGAETSLGKLD
ncbi:hypothetical protein TNCV_462011 [Trichonephila clavipes]|uniref:Uncharacterized protein n=1 Tax=Trichonephila clavipes TaxID=2585209 RepID=A0A8X6UNZ7_TRICX|nr:hypothetical protein TNCV_462011 [Trichonephila clavipes]